MLLTKLIVEAHVKKVTNSRLLQEKVMQALSAICKNDPDDPGSLCYGLALECPDENRVVEIAPSFEAEGKVTFNLIPGQDDVAIRVTIHNSSDNKPAYATVYFGSNVYNQYKREDIARMLFQAAS